MTRWSISALAACFAAGLSGCLGNTEALRADTEAARVAFERGASAAERAEDGAVGALASAVTVEGVAAAVLRRNPGLLAALERCVAALEGARVVASPPYPTLRYGYGSMLEMHSAALEQMLPWPGKLLADGRAALADARALRADAGEREGVLRERAIAATTALWLARRQVVLVDESIELMERFVATAEAKYTVGAVPEADVLRAQVERGVLQADRALFLRDVEVAEAAVNALLDRPIDAPLGPVSAFEPASPAAPLPGLMGAARTDRPRLAAARARLEAASEAAARATLEWVPDFMVGGAYVRDARMGADEWEVMGGITLPIWPGRVGGSRAAAAAREREAEAELRAAEAEVLEEVRVAAARLDAAAERRRALAELALPPARQNVEVSESSYVTGRIDLLALIDAERMLLVQELELARAEAEQRSAAAALERAIGAAPARTARGPR